MPATFSRIRARVAIPLLLLTAAAGFAGYNLASASTPYSVQSGDTLYDIAVKNGVAESQLDFWVSQVVALNSLKSPDALTVGQKLTLPVALSGGGSSSAGGGVSSTVAASNYTVKAGDTLYGIAAGIGVSDIGSWVDSVLSLNNLDSADTIGLGDVLKLPASRSSSSGATGSSATPTTTTIEYTVQAGDTLYDIAIKNGVSEKELTSWLDSVLKLNSLDSPDMIALGKALKVPSTRSTGGNSSSTSTIKTTSTVTYVVKPGDTLYDIGMKNGARDASFSAWVDAVLSLNNLSSPDLLREGDSLKLPDLLGSGAGGGGGAPGSQSNTAAAGAFAFSGDSVTYAVKAGDTWTGVARKLLVPEDQVAPWIENALKLSHMGKDEKLAEGIVLLVPAPGSITATATGSSATAPSSDSTSAAPATPKVTSSYTVQSGDTLSDIAAKYKIGFGQLSSWIKDVLALNKLDSPDVLTVGQKLVVPGEAPGSSSAAPTTQPSSAATSSTPATTGSAANKPTATPPSFAPPAAASSLVRGNNGTCYYTILTGDSWDSIAKKLGVSDEKKADWIDGIAALNGIKGSAAPVGDAIRLLC